MSIDYIIMPHGLDTTLISEAEDMIMNLRTIRGDLNSQAAEIINSLMTKVIDLRYLLKQVGQEGIDW